MTSEIAILNKSAIALAADSAGTVSGGLINGVKINNSVNKLFALSKYQPVAIMVYGSSELMEVPWETIIKSYKSKLGNFYFKTLKEYYDDFIDFLENRFFTDSIKNKYFKDTVFYFFKSLINESENNDCLINQIIDTYYEKLEELNFIESVLEDIDKFREDFFINYRDLINELIHKLFVEKFQLNDKFIEKLSCMVFNLFFKQKFITSQSGIVIAGFGTEEIYPVLFSFEAECVVNNKFKYIETVQHLVEHEGSTIIPFAQDDMIRTFVEGVDPKLQDFFYSYFFECFKLQSQQNLLNIKSKLQGIVLDKNVDSIIQVLEQEFSELNNKLIDRIRQQVIKYGFKEHQLPILTVVGFLPKDQLAFMADALINLTSLKRKISTDDETVGGPVDVLVISKGDGLIWIKRKHYFEPNLNHQFFLNYFNK